MTHTNTEKALRYFVGSQPTAHGGWFVAAVILSTVGGKETSRFYRQNIKTKKEAKALAAQLNAELAERFQAQEASVRAEIEGRAW